MLFFLLKCEIEMGWITKTTEYKFTLSQYDLTWFIIFFFWDNLDNMILKSKILS